MRAAFLLGIVATALLVVVVVVESRDVDVPSDTDVVERPASTADDARPAPPRRAPAEPTVDVPIVVRDPTTRAPFARAEIEWSMEFDDDPPEHPSSAGRGTTDETGRLVVQAKRQPRVVAVRIGYGGEWVRWTRSAHAEATPVVDVAPTPRIALQVVGDRGPVDDVMVAIGYRTNQIESAGEPKPTGGPDSLAVFDVPNFRGSDDAEFFATVLAPMPAPVRVPLTFAPPPSTPVRIRLPPTGGVSVRLVGPDGAAWTAPTQVTIEAAGVGTSATGATYRIARDGVAVFPAVGVGVTLDVLVFSTIPSPAGAPPTPCVTTRLRIAGPTVAGQSVAATAHVGVARACVVGRFVDAHGNPVARRYVSARFLGSAPDHAGPAPSDATRSDAEGRFCVSLDVEPSARSGDLQIGSCGTPDAPRPEFEVKRVSWPADHPDRLDLGDVVLDDDAEAPTTLVSGRFTWPQKFPFRGGYVWVARRVGERFDLLSDLRADAAADGRFAVRGVRPDEDRVWLVGESQGALVDAAVEFEPGAKDVELRLVESGGLGGGVVLPNGVDGISSLAVTIEGEPTRSWRHAGATTSVAWQGSMFWADGLRPGVVDVVVRAPGRDEVLARIENVEIKAGARSNDPQLAKIDLTRLAQLVTARVVGADGKPLAGVAVWSRPAAPAGAKDVYWARGLSGADGSVRRVGFGEAFEFVATAPGFASAQARDVARDATLVLRPARPSRITVRLASTVERPAAPLSLAVRLTWCGTADAPIDGGPCADPRSFAAVGATPFAADGTAKFDVADPGRWRAVLMVQVTKNGGGHGQELRPPRSTEVVVTETPQPLEIVVDADPATYAAVCRELSK
jgi:hypothetical protein